MTLPCPMNSITLNGQARESSAATIAALLEELGLHGRPVLVEHNGEALFPRQFSETPVAAGDRIELIELAAGG